MREAARILQAHVADFGTQAARAKFLEPESSIEEALALVPEAHDPVRASRRHAVGPAGPYGAGLAADIQAFVDVLSNYPWTELAEGRSDPALKQAVEAAEHYLQALRKALED